MQASEMKWQRDPLTICPTRDALAAYSQGRLTGREWESVSFHLVFCRRCIHVIGEFDELQDGLVEELRTIAFSKEMREPLPNE